MDKETEEKGAVRHGLIMADGSVSIRNDGTVGLETYKADGDEAEGPRS